MFGRMTGSPSHHAFPDYVVSRWLLLGWCFWLLASWLLMWSIESPPRSPVIVQDLNAAGEAITVMRMGYPADAFARLVQGMLQMTMIGLLLAWPAWRLSVSGRREAALETGADLAAMLLVTQVVILLVNALVRWSWRRLMLIDATFVVWGALVGLIVWFGRKQAGGAARTAAMLACAAVVLGGWMAAMLLGTREPLWWSPLFMLWQLCEPDATVPLTSAAARRLAVVAAVVLLAWLAARTRPGRGAATSPADPL